MSAARDLVTIPNPLLQEMPQNLEAEACLLGSILFNNAILHRLDFLSPMHFFVPVHQRIFEAILKLIADGKGATPITLGPLFSSDVALKDIGGSKYLIDLYKSNMGAMNAIHYGQQIVDAHTRREIIEAAADAQAEAMEASLLDGADKVLERFQERLGLIEAAKDTSGDLGHIASAIGRAREAAEKAYQNQGKVTGISTGIRSLDRRIGGLQPGDLLIIAGRPGMAKTALATNIAHSVAKAFRAHTNDLGKRVLDAGGVVGFFSLEMSSEQLIDRIIAGEIGIPADRIRNGGIDGADFQRYFDEGERLERLPLFIDDQVMVTIGAMRSRARRLKRKQGLDLIIVDYLQLMSGTGAKRDENRVQEISEITRGLKTMAKELGVPVIALSQLSRDVEKREDKRPQLSDLRDSGSIEQDADIVMFVYREEYYLSNAEPTKRDTESQDKFDARRTSYFERLTAANGKGEIIIGKQRHGSTGVITLAFDGPRTRWYDQYDQGAQQ